MQEVFKNAEIPVTGNFRICVIASLSADLRHIRKVFKERLASTDPVDSLEKIKNI